MKKFYLIATILITAILLTSLTLAFWPFTGNVVSDSDPCEEDDDGIDEFTAGSITYLKKSWWRGRFTITQQDTCSGSYINEWYCDDNDKPKKKKIKCAASCEEGACIQQPGPGDTIVGVCEDSDDGSDATTAGVVVNPLSETVLQELPDECIDDFKIKEAICVNGYGLYSILKCQDDAAGKCTEENITFNEQDYISASCVPQPESCEDTDDEDYATRGTVTVTNAQGQPSSESDRCLRNGKLREYSCDGDALASEDVDCEQGKICSSGACVDAACVDSDNGKEYSIQGETSTEHGIFIDVCLDNRMLLEGYCHSAGKAIIKVKSQICRNGCEQGACAAPAPSSGGGGGGGSGGSA